MGYITDAELRKSFSILTEKGLNTVDTSSLVYFFAISKILSEKNINEISLDAKTEGRNQLIKNIEDLMQIDADHIWHPQLKSDWRKSKDITGFVTSNLLTTIYSRKEVYPKRTPILDFTDGVAKLYESYFDNLKKILSGYDKETITSICIWLLRTFHFDSDKVFQKDIVKAIVSVYNIDMSEMIYIDTIDTSSKNKASLNSLLLFAIKKEKVELNDNNTFYLGKNALFKPFLILAGISGTGKTRFVRQQAELTGKNNYCLVSVRPDWHEPSDLLGYISHLGSKPKYITTDVLRFIVQAWKHIADSGFDLKTGKVTKEQLNEIQPYWLCLDEMNLAPVEQYFADYLSVLETRQWNGEVYQCDPLLKPSVLENIQPNDLGLDEGDVLWEHFKEAGVSIPFNLIVAGTVNMDETTHGFSRKVLDRALSFDFNEFYPNDFNAYFLSHAQNKTFTYPIYSDASLSLNFDSPFVKESCEFLSEVNNVLKNSPFELAYRALNELLLAVKCINPQNEIELQSIWDDFLMMKVLPRIEGDSEKLDFDGEKSLLTNLEAIMSEQLSAIWEGKRRIDLFRETNEGDVINIECRSKAKISWMQTKLEKFGFTHFWK